MWRVHVLPLQGLDFLESVQKKKKKNYMWNLALKFLQVQGLDFLSKCAKN